MTVEQLKKAYKLNEGQMKEIRDAMEIADRAIQGDMPGRKSSFESRMARIVGENEVNWFVAEEFAQAFFIESKWQSVFRDFYASELKFKSFMEDWEKEKN